MWIHHSDKNKSFCHICSVTVNHSTLYYRIMRPDDANIVGNVHGGIILKMIEEAGCIVGTRHCNTQNGVRGYNTF